MSDLAVFEFKKAVIANCKGNAWIVLEYLHRKDRYYRSKGQKSFYHSRLAIAEATGLTLDQVRTALDKLIGAGLITKKAERGVCGSRVWEVVEFPTSSVGKNPQLVGEKSPASRGKIPTHKAIEKSNKKEHAEKCMPAPLEKEVIELVEAIRPLALNDHDTSSLAKDAAQRGVTPKELQHLVTDVQTKNPGNPGGLLRRKLQAGDVERLRAKKKSLHEADVRRRMEANAQLLIQQLEQKYGYGAANGWGLDRKTGTWTLRNGQQFHLNTTEDMVINQIKNYHPNIKV